MGKAYEKIMQGANDALLMVEDGGNTLKGNELAASMATADTSEPESRFSLDFIGWKIVRWVFKHLGGRHGTTDFR